VDSIELNVNISPRNPWAEILVSQLAEYGFDSFVDTEEGIQAYGMVENVQLDEAKNETLLSSDSEEFKLEYTETRIPHQNWNALWESDFQPVFVGDQFRILAPFHDNSEAKGMTIVIQPQMSFGTGHHQTTWMMSKALLEMEQMPKNVLDMGTGTGVLAILAEKRGATSILAIDIEDWSVENTIENAARNGCKNIEALCGNVDLIAGKTFDLILANINKNILKAHLESYSNALKPGGLLFLSGFFESDVDEMIEFAAQFNLKMKTVHTKETWAAVELEKTESNS
jgi:ribosomal protein L11 methyltransferase